MKAEQVAQRPLWPLGCRRLADMSLSLPPPPSRSWPEGREGGSAMVLTCFRSLAFHNRTVPSLQRQCGSVAVGSAAVQQLAVRRLAVGSEWRSRRTASGDRAGRAAVVAGTPTYDSCHDASLPSKSIYLPPRTALHPLHPRPLAPSSFFPPLPPARTPAAGGVSVHAVGQAHGGDVGHGVAVPRVVRHSRHVGLLGGGLHS